MSSGEEVQCRGGSVRLWMKDCSLWLGGSRVSPSRKTGYKIFDRYQECGVHGLTDRSWRPYRYANQLPFQVENYILNVKREHPSWGARKIRECLTRMFTGIPIPAKSTIHAVLGSYSIRMMWHTTGAQIETKRHKPTPAQHPTVSRHQGCNQGAEFRTQFAHYAYE